MCYHTRTPSKEALGDLVESEHIRPNFDLEDYEQYYHVSGFSHPSLPVIAEDELQLKTWGLVPFWAKDPAKAKEIQNRTLNAVGETVFEKASYKGSIMKYRCVLPVAGFYEWRDYQKKKYPYYITSETGLLYLACIYAGDTFSIVTTAANELLEGIHNTKKRMPLVLNSWREWVNLEADRLDVMAMMQTPDIKLKAWTISDRLNHFQRQNTNTEDITDPVQYPELPPL